MYNNFPISVEQQQALWAFAARQQITTQSQLAAHQVRNQMDLATMKEAEKWKSDVCEEKKFQKIYATKGQDGQLILIVEGFHGKKAIDLPVWEIISRRLRYAENHEESVIFLSFLLGRGEDAKRVELFLDEKRIGEKKYVNQSFTRKGVGFCLKEIAEETARRKFLEMEQGNAKEILVPEIPGWYNTPNGWDYWFLDKLCWKEVIRWAL